MRFLRTTSTRHLLAGIAGLLVAIVAGSAIAIAATGGGPKPAPKPLARAIHDAMAAPAVAGISARITFTNHLIDATDIQGVEPLLTGGSGRLWVSPGHGLRLELQSNNGDTQIVVDRSMFWAYDPTAQTVYEGHLPAAATTGKGADKGAHDGLPSVAAIQSVLTKLGARVSVSGAVPSDVAGRPAYTVTVSPRANGGLVGGAALAFDAARGVPLRFALYARGDSAPVLELKATDISYGRVSSSVFSLRPPSGAKVVNIDLPAGAAGTQDKAHGKARTRATHPSVAGVRAVASHLRFPLAAPAGAGGLSRSSVRLLGTGAHAGALVVYGQGLGGIYVIERPSTTAGKAPTSSPGSGPGLSLPTVSINGATAQELATPLGTVLRFTRAGVSYTLFGSVTQAAAERAARAL